MFCCLQKTSRVMHPPTHMGCVRKSSHDVRETEKNNTTSCCPSNGNKKQKPKNKQTRGCEIFEAAKAQHENGGKTLAGWSWNSHKCFFLYRIYHQPFNLYLLHYSCRKGFVNPLRYTLSNLIRFKIKMRKRDCLLFTDKHYFRLCIGACLESFWIKFGHHWCPLMAKQT